MKKPDYDELCAMDELALALGSVQESIQIARNDRSVMDLIYPALMGAAEEFYRFRVQKAQLEK